MSDKSIRIGQLIAPFGPGSLYTDKKGISQIICGLDHWYKRISSGGEFEFAEDLSEFIINESRLSRLLKVDQFRSPPDFRAAQWQTEAPPNSFIHIPTLRFPRWYRNSKTRELRRFNLETRTTYQPREPGKWVPVRFITVCDAGHLSDFPWKQWCGCRCENDDQLRLEDRGGSDLASITVSCFGCNQKRSLSGITRKPIDEQGPFSALGISCDGERPWLGDNAKECGCNRPLVGALINQTNIYFSKVVSAISIPDLEELNDDILIARNCLEKDAALGVIKFAWRSNKKTAIRIAQGVLENFDLNIEEKDIEKVLVGLFDSEQFVSDKDKPLHPESEIVSFRRSEFNTLRKEINDSIKYPNLRILKSQIPQQFSNYFSQISLVERLREVRVFYGFDRLTERRTMEGMPQSALNQLFKEPPVASEEQWLPAIEVFGEGIFVELSDKRFREWFAENKLQIKERINDEFISRLYLSPQILAPIGVVDSIEWAAKYLLVHTFAHVLINEMVFDCGYSTSSLRERIYVSTDSKAPMAGLLIYTAAGDSEGTLGGLVQLGRADRFSDILIRAINRASWCSADPICSERLGGHGTRITNLAACQACSLLPETACETINNGLDRAMLVGTPNQSSFGFFSDIVGKVFCF